MLEMQIKAQEIKSEKEYEKLKEDMKIFEWISS
jgi:hypothetical protein